MSNALGELDELVLLATGIQHGDAYAYSIKQEIKRQSNRRVALPTIHAALYRLEERGYLRSEMGGATTERGGRRKRLYTLTNAGLNALREMRTVRDQMWRLMQGLAPGGGAA